jgi:hypothetical protein
MKFDMNDLSTCLDTLKKRSAPGPDGIKNIQLLHLPPEGKALLLKIANASWNHCTMIDDWTISQVTMIDKKTDDKSNPKNYHSISLTSSVFKLVERPIKQRLDRFLDKYKIINKYQPDCKENRQTLDNLSYLVESANQARIENLRNKVYAVVFEISKAFDKAWHNGLIYKLYKLKQPH